MTPDTLANTLRDLAESIDNHDGEAALFWTADRAVNYALAETPGGLAAMKRIADARALAEAVTRRKAPAGAARKLRLLADALEGKRRRKAGRPQEHDPGQDGRLLRNVAASGLSAPQYDRMAGLAPGTVRRAQMRARKRAAGKPVKPR